MWYCEYCNAANDDKFECRQCGAQIPKSPLCIKENQVNDHNEILDRMLYTKVYKNKHSGDIVWASDTSPSRSKYIADYALGIATSDAEIGDTVKVVVRGAI